MKAAKIETGSTSAVTVSVRRLLLLAAIGLGLAMFLGIGAAWLDHWIEYDLFPPVGRIR